MLFKRPQYIGSRRREVGETCPRCDDPGCGMWLDTKDTDYVSLLWEWVCSRCHIKAVTTMKDDD